ncbi:glycosyltransferase family 9 protein [Desulfovibrio sp. TomC]|uniref:glycosyltransferase family 9 protein n=1 Tax=Desulfovibrio sp. TomC TaxID=1562888 RepID=UPI000574E068|nr:glycosyltransferase family 9 protein [Desulfovibrio sp. TomC]KHK03608.1 heptosyltransferase family protein [Desulfovibrio sp. TomC]
MARFLVLQLARLGDLVQTRRLLAGLEAKAAAAGGGEVHLAVDRSLAGLAGRLYPFAQVHSLPAHAGPGRNAAETVMLARQTCGELAASDFDRVFCLNFSPLGMAVTAMFPPEVQRGYRQYAGQTDKDALLRLVFRIARDRRGSGLNLADIWAHLDDDPLPAAQVNPVAVPRGGGLGVALAGRAARRSLSPDILAPIVRTLFRAGRASRLTLLGTAAQAGEARSLLRKLDPTVAAVCDDRTGQTDLAGLCDAIAGLDRLITPDTGAMHLAAFYGVPTTAFFLSSAWCHETGPYGVGHEVWQATAPCAPCLESAPCDQGQICRLPFADPGFQRALAGSAKADLPPKLALFATDCDDLGAVCRLARGEDASLAARQRFRDFLRRRLLGAAAAATEAAAGRELAERLLMETDWVLPPPERPGSGEW